MWPLLPWYFGYEPEAWGERNWSETGPSWGNAFNPYHPPSFMLGYLAHLEEEDRLTAADPFNQGVSDGSNSSARPSNPTDNPRRGGAWTGEAAFDHLLKEFSNSPFYKIRGYLRSTCTLTVKSIHSNKAVMINTRNGDSADLTFICMWGFIVTKNISTCRSVPLEDVLEKVAEGLK